MYFPECISKKKYLLSTVLLDRSSFSVCVFFAHLCISSEYFSQNWCYYYYSKSLWHTIKREYLRRMRHARPRKAARTIQITTIRITIKLDIAATPKKYIYSHIPLKCPKCLSDISQVLWKALYRIISAISTVEWNSTPKVHCGHLSSNKKRVIFRAKLPSFYSSIPLQFFCLLFY